ncbi:MAG TPA: hypothetical protein VFS43_44420 [Polyangiaceae bacterium]|nr:hypothetical protein [Polyangiaceae bacterium]
MPTLCFRIKPAFLEPFSNGRGRAAELLQARLGLSATRAKGLVDRAVFGGEEMCVDVPSDELGWRVARELEATARPAKAKAWVERGRLGQDEAFEMAELVGRRVEQMVGIFSAEAPENLVLLYLKADAPPWHRLFLDAGIAFWEDWGRGLENEERDGVVIRDLGAACKLVGEQVSAAAARVSEERGGSTVIELRFASGARVELYFADPSAPDSSVTFSFTRPSPAARAR